jgi:hypothetical protein
MYIIIEHKIKIQNVILFTSTNFVDPCPFLSRTRTAIAVALLVIPYNSATTVPIE